MPKYAKFIVAAVGAVAVVLEEHFSDNPYVQAALLILTALGVYQVRNRPA